MTHLFLLALPSPEHAQKQKELTHPRVESHALSAGSLSLSPPSQPESFYSDGLQLLWHSVGGRDQNKNVYPLCCRRYGPTQGGQPAGLKEVQFWQWMANESRLLLKVKSRRTRTAAL